MFLKRPWDIINLFVIRAGNNMYIDQEIILGWRERYPHYGNMIEQKRYIKGKFSFRAPSSRSMHRSDVSQSVVIAFEISSEREGGWKKKRRQGTKGRMDEIAKHGEGSVENRDRVGNSNGEKKNRKIEKRRTTWNSFPWNSFRFQLCRHCRPVSIA